MSHTMIINLSRAGQYANVNINSVLKFLSICCSVMCGRELVHELNAVVVHWSHLPGAI